jgi:hypothetical protein
MIATVARRRTDEMIRLMQARLARRGRPPAAGTPELVRKRFRCAERRLLREITEAEAAVIYDVAPRTVREWVAWCLAPANDDPRADRCRALAGRRG